MDTHKLTYLKKCLMDMHKFMYLFKKYIKVYIFIYLVEKRILKYIYKCLPYRYDHAVVFANGSAASEEGDDENNRAYGYEKRGYGEETIIEEMLILMVHSMNDQAN